jgi:hypothetical protein
MAVPSSTRAATSAGIATAYLIMGSVMLTWALVRTRTRHLSAKR